MEQRVLFHSDKVERIAATVEAITSLVFPFAWAHVYIPLLPRPLVGYLQAPVPFIIGIPSSFLHTPDVAESVALCVIVEIDRDKV
jgi:hypothetical protein